MVEVLYSSLQQSCPVLSNLLSVTSRIIADGMYAALKYAITLFSRLPSLYGTRQVFWKQETR